MNSRDQSSYKVVDDNFYPYTRCPEDFNLVLHCKDNEATVDEIFFRKLIMLYGLPVIEKCSGEPKNYAFAIDCLNDKPHYFVIIWESEES